MVTIGRENVDPVHVARYDLKEDAGAAREVSFLIEHGLGPQSTLVDLGAGTGQFILAAAAVCGRAIAVEISPMMLTHLREKVSASGLANIEVVEAGFLTYGHAGAAADFVYSRWSLHHLPDFWKAMALRHMREVLRPGGGLRLADIVFSFGPEELEDRIEAWCATLPARPPGGDSWSRADIEEHVRDEHSTFTWILEPMLERSGFEIEEATYSDDGIRAEYLARAR
jgi:ubiquinone/menaquinone biosynthesis C-methylase UbiE